MAEEDNNNIEKKVVTEASAGEAGANWTAGPSYSATTRRNTKITNINGTQVPGQAPNKATIEVAQNPIEQNKNFTTFANYRANIEKIIDSQGILNLTNPGLSRSAYFSISHDSYDDRYVPLVSDKIARLNQYRIISEFPESYWCIREICSDFLTYNSQGQFIRMNLSLEKQKDLNDVQLGVLQDEFNRLVSLFDIKNNIYDIISTFLIEGEVAWENIIRHDTPTLGIVAVKRIRNDFYDLLIDKENGDTCGIYFDLDRYSQELQYSLSAFYSQSAQIFNTMYTNGFRGISFSSAQNIVPMLWPQLTYFSSDRKSPNRRICYSAIEDVKQSYYQLVLLQDAAVILRITRAPVRLLFNISTGGMNERTASEYVRKVGNQLKMKKTARIDREGNGSMITNTYNPSTMLETWVFGKSNANEGTTVSNVESTANYNEIDDIKYFLRRFIKQWGVPYSRYDQDKEPSAVRASTEISQEEFSFAKLLVHYQDLFAAAIKKTFITHLKLREIWKQYKLNESDINIEFLPPYIYVKYIAQQEISQQMEVYSKFADRDEFSKTWAAKRYLNLSDKDITENNKLLLFDKYIAKLGEDLPEKITGGMSDEAKSALIASELGNLQDALDLNLEGGSSGGDEGGDEGGENEGGEDDMEEEGGEDDMGEEI